jgi:hypothetical protein
MTEARGAVLWASDSCAAWTAALDRYPAVVAGQAVNGLVELDAWYREALPGILAGRTPPWLTHDELVEVTRWKMKRGVWRERNRQLVAGNDPALVEAVSRDAFAAAPDPRAPITLLCTLAGVGPATASAALAAHAPAVYPFFDELVAVAIPDLGPVAWAAAYYARYAERLRERAAALAAACPEGGWTAQAVSQALWAASGGKAGLP